MSKAYMLAFLLMFPLAGCLEDENCGTVENSNELMLDEDVFYELDISVGDSVKSISYNFQRYDDEGHNIDVYVLDDINYQQYENDNSFVYIGELSWDSTSSLDFSKEASGLDENDDYYFIVDNTYRGGSSPPSDGVNNVVHFSYTMTVEKCSN